MDDILVSIDCITYNHEKYIEKAIEGFLMQKTSFKYEIIIGDDCSTDKTQEIIKKYVKQYPDKIKLVTSEKNVGARKNSMRVFEASRGKYIALCEGDDYWTDENKLERQIEYMEKNQDCSICIHNAVKYDDKNEKFLENMIEKNFSSKKIYIEDYFKLRFIPTASILMKRSIKENLPDFYYKAVVDDLLLMMLALDMGYGYYMEETMSVYRVNNVNSMMSQWKVKHNTIQQKVELLEKYISIFNEFNKYTNYKYDEALKKEIKRYKFDLEVVQGNYKNLKKDEFIRCFNKLSQKDKMKIRFIGKMPKTYEKLILLRSIYKQKRGK